MHQSVLLEASIAGLNIIPDGVYIDGTFGRGGHTEVILKQLSTHGRVIALDKDQEAIDHGKAKFIADNRIIFIHDSFANIELITKKLELYGHINGILLDLGVSSPQLDNASRGFSFKNDGPLDMRMDNTNRLSAAEFIANASIDEMMHIFRIYGEERYAGRIARAIETARNIKPILTTIELAEIVKSAHPRWEKHKHPATRVFQAIRIHINQELTDLSVGLSAALKSLSHNGRLAVISFHSLEDRIVKNFMRHEEVGEPLPRGLPIKEVMVKRNFRRIGKAIKPSDNEIRDNIRARSAILRIGEKLA